MICGEILITILVLILDYFQEEPKTKFFKKSKKTYFGAILGLFSLNLGKNEFCWKKGLCQFLNIPLIYYRAKSQKKRGIPEKNAKLTDGLMD